MGIDPSTETGLAVVEEADHAQPCVLHAEEVAPKLVGFARASAIVERMLAVRVKWEPDLIIIEEMIVHHTSSAIPIIALGTIIRYFLWQMDVQYVECGPTALKKWISEDGKATKEQMMMFVLDRFGYKSATNNIADAVALAMYGLQHPDGGPKRVKKPRKMRPKTLQE